MPRYQEQGRSTPGPVQPAHGLGVRNMAPIKPRRRGHGIVPGHFLLTPACSFSLLRGWAGKGQCSAQ